MGIQEMNKLFHKGTTSGKNSLTSKQIEQLRLVLDKLEHKVLIELAIATGMRRSDIVAVETKNIDFDNRKITFYQHKKRNMHTVYVSQELINLISMWVGIHKNKWIFPSHYKKRNTHLSSRAAYNILQRALDHAELPQRPFHALRATCVKMCQRAGWSAEQTAELLDDRVSTIQLHYSTPSDEEMKKLAEDRKII